MSTGSTDTIAAPITPPGAGPVSVIRLSGPETRRALCAVFDLGERCLKSPRRAVLGRLRSADGETLDRGLGLFFPAPGSFTGEDCAELQFHGSPYLVQRLMRLLAQLGCRTARAGEFTERAFHNGKLDLIQAEAISDLIAAETEAQAKLAREQLEGKLSLAIQRLGEPLRDVLAEVEAQLDFPEEELDGVQLAGWSEQLKTARLELERYLDSFEYGRLTREGLYVAILGLPNAGKSSLLNRLAGEDRAIVTPIPGTTRDTIEEHLSLDGCLIRLCDTAGLAENDSRELDLVERLGIERSWNALARADLALYVIDPEADLMLQGRMLHEVEKTAKSVLAVVNKSDLSTLSEQTTREICGANAVLAVSARTGAGLCELRDALKNAVLDRSPGGASALIASERHRSALKESDAALERALTALGADEPPEIVAFEIRYALSALNEIIGVTTSEDVLERIFSRFCIGK